jgi:hypothetical protein
VEFLGGDHRETVGQVKPHLVAKHRFGAGSSPVTLVGSVVKDVPH